MTRVYSPKDLALVMQTRRKNLDLSQSHVAERVGLKQKTVSGFERHPDAVELNTLFLLLSALNLDLIVLPKEDDRDSKNWKEEW